VESHDVRGSEVIVSSSHAFAKGVLTTAEQLHVSYVHSPMRYAWDLHHQYLEDYRLTSGAKGLLARYVFHQLRQWDRQTANNADLFLANSRHVQLRIWRAYRRHARVLYPPVAVERFTVREVKEDFYVTVSRLVSYKRVDLILKAFARLPDRRLFVIGDGPDRAELARHCPPNVTLLGWQPDDVVDSYLGAARAFVFAAHEDFGISPVEAQACGTPVIAFGRGGATETVQGARTSSEPTGVLFPEQTAQSLADGVREFESTATRISSEACRRWAERFSEARFRREFTAILEQAWNAWQSDPSSVERKLVPVA
jgi:glycosyltransferase involved in cell wall biosynthesis